MRAFIAVSTVTLRGLMGRRRILLMLLLVALPLLAGIAIRTGGGRANAPAILDTLVIRTVLPLVALVVGGATLGSEIEDGTIVYLIAKPVRRWIIALAKLVVATGSVFVLVIPAMLLTGVIVGTGGSAPLSTPLGYTLAAVAGAAAYSAVFTALGAVTSRALVVGLAYTLIWEGVLAGLLEGTRVFSIRQATLGLAAAITGNDLGRSVLDPTMSVAVIVIAVVGAFAVTTLALRRSQVRAGD